MPSLLLALDNPKVNYLSLDIEGAELQVLRSVPWHLVDIEVTTLNFEISSACFMGKNSFYIVIRFWSLVYLITWAWSVVKVISVEFGLIGKVFPGSRGEVSQKRCVMLIENVKL